MFDLPLEKATLKTVKGHRYYVFSPTPHTHKNQKDRPPKYADEHKLTIYKAKGTNNSARLLPEVHSAANALMTAMIRYGEKINDWSMRSAVIQSGYRPDDASQGASYLRIIKVIISRKPDVFGDLQFPANLETEAQGILGRPGDPRRQALHDHVAASPGWNRRLTDILFNAVDNVYAPRGANPHTTGLVFDLDFWIFDRGSEKKLGADTRLNDAALRSAAGMWLNKYSKLFGFDSYDTGREIWHMEWRNPKTGPGSPDAIQLYNSCGPALETADDLIQYVHQAVAKAVQALP
jgi:hypothetical protein